jgi:hypothetical protein
MSEHDTASRPPANTFEGANTYQQLDHGAEKFPDPAYEVKGSGFHATFEHDVVPDLRENDWQQPERTSGIIREIKNSSGQLELTFSELQGYYHHPLRRKYPADNEHPEISYRNITVGDRSVRFAEDYVMYPSDMSALLFFEGDKLEADQEEQLIRSTVAAIGLHLMPAFPNEGVQATPPMLGVSISRSDGTSGQETGSSEFRDYSYKELQQLATRTDKAA